MARGRRIVAPMVIIVIMLISISMAAQVHANESNKMKKLVRLQLNKVTTVGAGELKQAVTSYYMNIDIGTPPKPFKMLVDVNARENFVPHYSNLGWVCTRLNYRNGYSKKDSSTSEKEEGDPLTIGYLGCSLSGKAYQDLFVLKNVLESYKEVKYKQRFLAMSTASNDKFYGRHAVDGVVALNPWPISATGSELLSVGLARAELMGELKFALHLVNPELDSSELGGELTLGGVNPTKFLGALIFHQVHTQHSWELPLDSVLLGGHVISIGHANNSALISTSSNGITGPPGAINQILELLGVQATSTTVDNNGPQQSKLHSIDCNRKLGGPALSFMIEDSRYSIPPSAYIKQKPGGFLFKTSDCYLDLYTNNAEHTKWELGTNFLTNFYTVFDINHRRLALGSLNHASLK